jgi:hypothetical protein
LTAAPAAIRFGVRTIAAFASALALAGIGVICWQRSQISRLQAQVSLQGGAIAELSDRFVAGVPAAAAKAALPRGADDAVADLRADERRLILDQYRDVISQLNLPPETASRLQDLLTDRVETVLDAQNAAIRVGFAEGSAETARAVALAVAGVDRDIMSLVGVDAVRRIDGPPAAPAPEPLVAPEPAMPASPTVVVTVVVQAPAPAYVPDSAAQAPDTGAAAQYSTFPYFYTVPVAYLPRRAPISRFGGLPPVAERPRRGQDRVTFR